jgi:hypothetical protein
MHALILKFAQLIMQEIISIGDIEAPGFPLRHAHVGMRHGIQ